MKPYKYISAILAVMLLEILSSDYGLNYVDAAAVEESPQIGSIRFKRDQAQDSVKSGVEGDKKNNSIVVVSTPGSNAGKNVKPSVKQKTVFIPDRSPANLTTAQMRDLNSNEDEDEEPESKVGQGEFDEKAVQRAMIVIAGIAVIIVTYLGIKFILIKKRKVVKRYGRVEASEMDLLDEIEDDESEEEEELFDINQQRRS